ncbi:uncharacterized protein LOC131995754 [Stomoxys calcitrans]|uniref:uncharacterized protein LOC131995754 n=1 Tax=Stomoxys calcitrans TaxID=35570 RepID=UPI0027E320FB|nr:uncharacterized protein LOC131995754 [Stomoxys calcitrans]
MVWLPLRSQLRETIPKFKFKRGLSASTEIKDIKEELDEIVPNTETNVTIYKTQRNNNTGLFLVSLFPDKGLSDISGIRGLQSQIVSWEKPRRKDSEIQCRRGEHCKEL